ncbi:lipopolysaccharide biosynthesis protein [Phenylobacterium sp.]|uniref:lipopolysaccharide biosynthesis protein n=1 Tax=Phenylobacterium sp. TaxID=1871053 RepID=UPI002730E8AA|nr:lipopolysaccharide biosynthesis protein [Phenylobacterium sp.]MDP1618450.1 lipopolysaccharide biosynthesis protein [Phenylobacterium sp.]MDP1988057.1 lipopolysaccharide biosynthesis protein [Phenylobacterium sp.]
MSAEAPQDGVLRRVLANTGVLLGGRAMNAVLSLGYMALAARSLGIGAFGVLVLINTFAQFVSDVAKFQAWQSILHFGAAPLAEGRREVFQRVVRFGLVLDLISVAFGVCVGAAGAWLLGPSLGLPEAAREEAAVYALSVAVLAPTAQVGLLRLFDRFGLLAAQGAISSAVRLAGGALGMAMDAPLVFFLVVWGLGSVAAFAYVTAAAALEMRRRDLWRGFSWAGPLAAGMPKAWRFAWATNASSSVDVAFTHVATLAVGALAGAADAGLWRVARQIADALAKPARLLIPALYPELAKLHASGRRGAMGQLALRVGLVGGATASLLLFVAVVAGDTLLAVVLDEDFAAAQSTMIWQLAAAVIGVWALPLEPMLVSMGRPGVVVWVRLTAAMAFLAALPFVIGTYGLPGAGAALVAATLAMAAGMLVRLWQITGSRRPDIKFP